MQLYGMLHRTVNDLSAVVRWLFALIPHVALEHNARVEVRCISKKYLREFEKDQFAWLAAKDELWLVRLLEMKNVDHCVLVDGSRRLIFSSAEKVPLELTAESLLLCGGPRVPNVHVEEMRELVFQREKKRGNPMGSQRNCKRQRHEVEMVDLTK